MNDALALELARYGLPTDAGLSGLLHHIYANRDAAQGAAMFACEQWKERALAAEAQLAAQLDRETVVAAVQEAIAWYNGENEHGPMAEFYADRIIAAVREHKSS